MDKAQRDRLLAYLVARGKEPTTWRGVVWILAALGVAVSPSHAEIITAAGMFAAGLIGAALPDPK